VRSLLREPLVHFLVLGGLLFLVSRGDASSDRIVIPQGQVASLAASFERTWMRPPSDDELKGLVDDFVREEIAVREASSQGLQEGDIVIRRRLRQKFEFLLEDEMAASPPGDAELQAWLDAHPEQFRRDPIVGFRQVFLSADRRGAAARADAEAALARLRAGADPASLGDPTLLPLELPPSELRNVSQQFGDAFAAALAPLPTGEWVGPVESGFGLHLVFVTAASPGLAPTLDQVREEVAREVLAARRAATLDSLYQRLSDRYRITIERSAPAAP
jgi:hypothetical protein